MIKPIMRAVVMLSRPSRPAGPKDAPLADDLRDTLVHHQHECVGMAANMIGASVAIIAFYDEEELREMFNPRIIEARRPYRVEEACLSLEGERGVERYKDILVAYEDRQGICHEERFSGFTAQIIQHEIDHCAGILV